MTLESYEVKHVLPVANKDPVLGREIGELGRTWAASASRPRIARFSLLHWSSLIDEWIHSDLPIAIRKSTGVRGKEVIHRTGRRLIYSDNSPAQWAFSRAYSDLHYSLDDIREFLADDRVPFAYATKRAEKEMMRYKCTLSAADNVNKQEWKLSHIEEVGLNSKVDAVDLPLNILLNHFGLLMKPSNHFLVPLAWAGLGELPEFIVEIRKFEQQSASAAIA